MKRLLFSYLFTFSLLTTQSQALIVADHYEATITSTYNNTIDAEFFAPEIGSVFNFSAIYDTDGRVAYNYNLDGSVSLTHEAKQDSTGEYLTTTNVLYLYDFNPFSFTDIPFNFYRYPEYYSWLRQSPVGDSFYTEGDFQFGNLTFELYDFSSPGYFNDGLFHIFDLPGNGYISFAIDLDFKERNSLSLQPIPEPTTFFLLGSGLAGLGLHARKRKKHNPHKEA